ncbi:MAG: PAS domain-containing protein [Chitinophagaceae bacterium]|nr:PAS domain-containing protein [Chitinophagaceae bacterium]
MQETIPIHILVIEDNPGDFLLLKEFLRLTALPIDKVTNADRLEEAYSLLKEQTHDLIFLDLSLPDSEGINTFVSLQKKAAHLPIIVLSGLTDVTVALESISLGAQDYLVKGEYTDKLLAKTIQYSIERKRNELKLFESNRRYELLSQATNDTIWDWDLVTNHVAWNDGIKTIFGYKHAEIRNEIDWWHQNIHPEDKERVVAKITRHIQAGLKTWKDEYRFRCINGNYKYVFDRGFILFNKDNNPVRLIGAMQDLTDRRKLEQQLTNEKINKQKQLTQATIEGQEKERSEISRELHDNINQILVTIKLYLELAMDDRRLKDDMIKRSAEKIMYCINEIRNLSKSLAPPSLNDYGLVEAITELIENIKLTKTFDISLNVKLESLSQFNSLQQLYIYRIIQEQLNNIIKHANAKNVSVELIENYQSIDLIIRDDGKGFNPKEKSSGIGLTNIQNRAELLNGTLEIISNHNEGCVLKVRIAEKSYHNLMPDLL